MDLFLANLAYGLMLVALMTRDVLWLRLTLLSAQALLAAYQYAYGSAMVAIWNVVFAIVNAVQAWWVIHDRKPVPLPESIKPFFEGTFGGMSSKEFLQFWRMAQAEIARQGDVMLEEGKQSQDLILVTQGDVAVRHQGRDVAQVGVGNFLGEMSFLTGAATSASCHARGDVHCVRWPQSRLAKVKRDNHDLYRKIHDAVARDLVSKLSAANRQQGGAA